MLVPLSLPPVPLEAALSLQGPGRSRWSWCRPLFVFLPVAWCSVCSGDGFLLPGPKQVAFICRVWLIRSRAVCRSPHSLTLLLFPPLSCLVSFPWENILLFSKDANTPLPPRQASPLWGCSDYGRTRIDKSQPKPPLQPADSQIPELNGSLGSPVLLVPSWGHREHTCAGTHLLQKPPCTGTALHREPQHTPASWYTRVSRVPGHPLPAAGSTRDHKQPGRCCRD